MLEDLVDAAVGFDEKAKVVELRRLQLTGECENPFNQRAQAESLEIIAQIVVDSVRDIRLTWYGKKLWLVYDPIHVRDLLSFQKERIKKRLSLQYGIQCELFELDAAAIRQESSKVKAVNSASDTHLADNIVDRYVFSIETDVWRVRFDGEESYFKDILGMGYLAKLLAAPHNRFTAAQLKQDHVRKNASASGNILFSDSAEVIGGQVQASGRSIDRAFDRLTLNQCEEKLALIQASWPEIRASCGLEHVEELERTERQLEDYLRKNRSKSGRARPQNDNRRSEFATVRQALKLAKLKLRSMPRFTAHLKQHLHMRGGEFYYHPPEMLDWRI